MRTHWSSRSFHWTQRWRGSGSGCTAAAALGVWMVTLEKTPPGNAGKNHTKQAWLRPAVSGGGSSIPGWGLGSLASWLCSVPSGADLSKALPLSGSQVDPLGVECPKLLSFFLQTLRSWDSKDFALNLVFMTLVSLCEGEGPAVGGISERHQVKSGAQGAGTIHALCATGLTILNCVRPGR